MYSYLYLFIFIFSVSAIVVEVCREISMWCFAIYNLLDKDVKSELRSLPVASCGHCMETGIKDNMQLLVHLHLLVFPVQSYHSHC